MGRACRLHLTSFFSLYTKLGCVGTSHAMCTCIVPIDRVGLRPSSALFAPCSEAVSSLLPSLPFLPPGSQAHGQHVPYPLHHTVIMSFFLLSYLGTTQHGLRTTAGIPRPAFIPNSQSDLGQVDHLFSASFILFKRKALDCEFLQIQSSN